MKLSNVWPQRKNSNEKPKSGEKGAPKAQQFRFLTRSKPVNPVYAASQASNELSQTQSKKHGLSPSPSRPDDNPEKRPKTDGFLSASDVYKDRHKRDVSAMFDDSFLDLDTSKLLAAVDMAEEGSPAASKEEKEKRNWSSPSFPPCTSTPFHSGKRSNRNSMDQMSPVQISRRTSNGGGNISESLTTEGKMELSSWSLPDTVLKKYHSNGVTSMFKWQLECLTIGNVLSGGNLVYCAPTSAGKTLVAEILMIKRVLEQKKKAIFILPFVSVSREKMMYLQNLLRPAGIRVEGFMGNHSPPGGFKAVDIAVCTIEKANSLINRLLEDNSLEQLGTVVVDELHLLGDPHRGYLLELLLTKIQYMAARDKNNIQIIGMSATLPNLDFLARWLKAEFYTTNFRPVPLTEYVKVGNTLYDSSMKKVRDIVPTVHIPDDVDGVVFLSLETVLQGFSVLIFCPSKARCETLAETISKRFYEIGCPDVADTNAIAVGAGLRTRLDPSAISQLLDQLGQTPVGLDVVLGRTVRFGVGFHHAGLTMDERDVVEAAFRHGALKVLIATSTLSSGVNLPAHRVVVRSPNFNGSTIDVLTYRQMVGRAGRKGVNTTGESILVCQAQEKSQAQRLVTSDLPPVKSCLVRGSGLSSSLKRAILEVIVSGVASTPQEVECYASCTLLATQLSEEKEARGRSQAVTLSQDPAENPISDCIKFLEKHEFIRLQQVPDSNGELQTRYITTQLGLACLSSSLPPDEALVVLKELQKARQCFVLENELHVVYQVTPIHVSSQWPNLDWLHYLSLWETLTPDVKRVGQLVGVEERFLVRAVKGTVARHIPKQAEQLAVHKRFYTALALSDLVNEVPLNTVAQKFGCNRGMLQNLQQAASTFAGMVSVFCDRLGWSNLELLLSQFQDRLQFGIQRELCDLVRLSTLNGQRARVLFDAGLTAVASVAASNPQDLETVLRNATPFQSNTNGANKPKKDGCVWVMGQKGVTEAEAARIIIEEAQLVLQTDLGVTELKWKKAISPSKSSPKPDLLDSFHTSSSDGSSVGKSKRKRKRVRSKPEKTPQRHSDEKKDSPKEKSTTGESSSESVEMFRSNPGCRDSIFGDSLDPDDISRAMKDVNGTKPVYPISSESLKTDVSSVLSTRPEVSRLRQDDASVDSPKRIMSPALPKMDESRTSSNEDESITDSFLERAFQTCWEATATEEEQKIIVTPRRASCFVTDSDTTDSSFVDKSGSSDSLIIVDVCGDKQLFGTFKQEWKGKRRFAISVGQERRAGSSAGSIGGKVSAGAGTAEEDVVAGISVSWEGADAYYMALDTDDNSHADTLTPVSSDESITLAEKVGLLRDVLGGMNNPIRPVVVVNNAADTFKCLCSLDVSMVGCRVWDIQMAHWLVEQGERPANLATLVRKYCPDAEVESVMDLVKGAKRGWGSLGLNSHLKETARLRTTVEAVVARMLMVRLQSRLRDLELVNTFQKVEMPAAMCMAEMDMNGIGFSLEASDNLQAILQEKLSALEEKAYELVGHPFALSSTKELANVLYIELRLGETKPLCNKNRAKTVGSVGKEALGRMAQKHPLPGVVILWRKVSFTLSKVLQPLHLVAKHNPAGFARIHPSSYTFTLTGRASMQEPNVQMVPNPFEVMSVSVSIRDCFVAPSGRVLVAADYCQMELRVLAHLAGDAGLVSAFQGRDPFQEVAARWNGGNEVSAEERQRAKEVCYGMIYGIGAKALADKLQVGPDEAQQFMTTFMSAYPGVQRFLQETVDKCRQCGYVETMHKRRRDLPAINSANSHSQAQAERQAINTTIQGSAADILKSAMTRIKMRLDSMGLQAHLVLQLHDELMYEVESSQVNSLAEILRNEMESAATLSVGLKVKVKVGPSWGQLSELKL